MTRKRQADEVKTLAVDREISEQIRDVATEIGASVYDVTNSLLRYALANAKTEVAVKMVVLSPADVLKKRGENPLEIPQTKQGRRRSR